ncbi:aminotransferase class III-fold pyridoxal phosphate-dependent enzyme [Gordonibacter massiliensis (ex Traore et al. 2017)]|uniref:Aminotransferase class III-fold pyridoxal phosphate-dependent enzyme n=1 Tax=Gordonibacter massiliensis (ex Traore et al. 2017) TaxID=1841863 RepID=A0A842JCL3_9ACTN|nr:aminotransferase class III-fold pyridoxal phosphate-dependent enzyme [Gordonibacter massiliensis (ex Traore et al. 2017)]MBC2889982.1 aminotransferase class III-fold pyridoxal phosphate-dependent enzyme [Gordonibacter massiliensis (ex Traore et al. 2017)]
MSLEEQQNLEATYVMHTFGRKPVEFVRGEGMELVDDQGNTYLDFIAGIGVISLGHCHPAVVGALQSQAERLIHVSNYYYIEGRGEVAHRLSDLLNAGAPADAEPWQSFFANSGAEANECAIKLARLHARKRAEARALSAGASADEARAAAAAAPRVIVTLDRSFHGRTMATLAATAQPAKQEAFQPLPDGFAHTPLNDVAALEALFAARGDEICAVMVECVQGEGGVHPCTPEFLAAARKLTEERGALLVCDEVQTGVFRCGAPFAFQRFGIVPDVVTIAKGVASGMPTGMCAARASMAAAFEPGDHGSTFGGSNLAVAAAQATLRTLADEGFAERVERVGAYLRARLAELPDVVEVRGLGLMVAADVAEGIDANDVVLRGLGEGLVLNATGPRTLRFLPPLVCEERHVDVLVEGLARLLAPLPS